MARNYKGISASVRQFSDNIDEAIAAVEQINLRAVHLKPALEEIVNQFRIMEQERFARQGRSPAYGHTSTWDPVADSTLNRRFRVFGQESSSPLKATGTLERAATNPIVKYEESSVLFDVNVQHAVREMGFPPGMTGPGWERYSKGKNYGAFHQLGQGRNPKREFVGIQTPQFRLIVKKIVAAYVWGEPLENFGLRKKAVLRDNKKLPQNERFTAHIAKRRDQGRRRREGNLFYETPARRERRARTPEQRDALAVQREAQSQARAIAKEQQRISREAKKPVTPVDRELAAIEEQKFASFHSWAVSDEGLKALGQYGLTPGAAKTNKGMHAIFMNHVETAMTLPANQKLPYLMEKTGLTEAGVRFYAKYGIEYSKRTGNKK